jgi:hypothetical protein
VLADRSSFVSESTTENGLERTQNAIDFVLASGVALSSLLNGLGRPLEKGLIPLATQAVQNSTLRQKKAASVVELPEPPRYLKVAVAAGPVFIY